MTDHRTPSEIERDIERERAQLTNTIEEIQDRFSPDAIFREIGRGFRDHGGDMGQAISRSVKENPVALALTGIGLAWLMFGRSWSERPAAEYRATGVRTVGGHTPPRSGLLDEDGLISDAYSNRAPMERRQAFLIREEHRYPSWAGSDYAYDEEEDDDETGDGMMTRAGGALSAAGGRVASGAASAGAAVGSGASAAGGAVASGARSAGAGIAGGARAAGSAVSSGAAAVGRGASAAGAGISSAASSAYAGAGRTYRRLSEGTEHLSEAARERVVAARSSALAARDRAYETAQRNWSMGRDAASDFYEEQPLVVGALAVAVGAAIAGALPRTRYEDDAFGAQSDHLFDEAERIYSEESAKARAVAGAALKEARSVLEDERRKVDESAPGGKGVVDAVKDEVKSAAARVADAAKSEAEKQKLGQHGSSDTDKA